MSERIQQGGVVDLDMFHTSKAMDDDKNSVVESQGQVNRDRGD